MHTVYANCLRISFVFNWYSNWHIPYHFKIILYSDSFDDGFRYLLIATLAAVNSASGPSRTSATRALLAQSPRQQSCPNKHWFSIALLRRTGPRWQALGQLRHNMATETRISGLQATPKIISDVLSGECYWYLKILRSSTADVDGISGLPTAGRCQGQGQSAHGELRFDLKNLHWRSDWAIVIISNGVHAWMISWSISL